MATDLTRGVLLALIPLASALGLLAFPLLLVLVVLFGTASLINDAASMSFMPRLVSRAHLQRAHARLDGADAVAQTAGPAVAGALIRVIGAPLAVLVDAVTYLFSAAMVAFPRGGVGATSQASANQENRGLSGRTSKEPGGSTPGRPSPGSQRGACLLAAQKVRSVVTSPYAFIQLRLSPFALGLVLAVGGVGALTGATFSTAVGNRLGTGGAIICSYAVSAAGP